MAGSLNPLLLPLFPEMSSLILPEPTLTVRASADSKSADPGGSSGSGKLALTRSILSFLDSCLSAMIDCIAGSATGQEERRVPRGLELAFKAEVSESLGVVPPWNLDSLDSILRRSSWVTWNVFSDILIFWRWLKVCTSRSCRVGVWSCSSCYDR